MLSAFFYAVNNYFWKVNLTKFSAATIIWSRAVFTLCISAGCIFLFEITGQDLIDAYQLDGKLFFMSTAFGIAGLVGMVQALKKSNLSELALFQALMVILSAVGVSLLKQISVKNMIGAILIIAAFLYYHFPQSNTRIKRPTFWYLIMVIGFVSAGFFNWQIIERHHPIIVIASQEFSVLSIFSAYGLIRSPHIFRGFYSRAIKMLGFAALIFFAIYFGAIGLKITDPFLLNLFGLITPFITALIGITLLKERWSNSFVISFSAVIVGVLIISF